MSCECNVCSYSHKVRHHLEDLNPEQREFFESMYDLLIDTEMDKDFYEAIIDGTWPDADQVIARRRERRKAKDSQ